MPSVNKYLSPEALEYKREYEAQYRKKNRKKFAEYQRTWRKKHTEEIHIHNIKYWERKAAARKSEPKTGLRFVLAE